MPHVANPTGAHRAKRRHHGEGTVVKRKDHWRAKPWVAVVPYVDPDGRRRQVWLSASSREEADDLRKAELVRRRRTLPTEHTVGSYLRDWLASRELSAATLDRYRQHIDARLMPTLGDVDLDAITPTKVRAAMFDWTGSPATRAGTLLVLRMAMRQAASDRIVADDPTAGVKAPPLRAAEPKVLDVDEARALRETVAGERFAPILTVALGLGLRRGEILGLRTADVDAIAGTITIRQQLRRQPRPYRDGPSDRWRLREPKADSGRTVPMPAFVAAAMATRIAERDSEKEAARVWAPNDLVFCTPSGNPISFTSLDRWWKAALKRAELPDMKFHGLRASTATILLAEGVDEFTVMRILGHRSLDMTRRYVKLLPRVSRAAADRMDDRLG